MKRTFLIIHLPPRGHIGGQDAVVVAVDDHGGQIIARDVLTEILNPGVDTGHRCDARYLVRHGPHRGALDWR